MGAGRRQTEEPLAGAGITQATTKWRASTTLAGIIQRTASPLGTIIMMATSTAVMASTLAARMSLARGSTTTSPPRLWPLETLAQGARSSTGSRNQQGGGPGGFKKHQHHHSHHHLHVYGGGGGGGGSLRNDILKLLKLIFEVWIMINDD